MRLLVMPILLVLGQSPFYCYTGDPSQPKEIACSNRSCVTRLLPREDGHFAVELDCNREENGLCRNYQDQTQLSVCCRGASRCNNAYAVIQEDGMNITRAAWLLAVEAEKLNLGREDRLPNPLPLFKGREDEETTSTLPDTPGKTASTVTTLLAFLLIVQYTFI